MFKKFISNYQSQLFANTWQHTLKHKEMTRNNLHISGDLKNAKTFVHNFHTYKPHTHFAEHGEHIIFSNVDLALATNPAYRFAN